MHESMGFAEQICNAVWLTFFKPFQCYKHQPEETYTGVPTTSQVISKEDKEVDRPAWHLDHSIGVHIYIIILYLY